MLEKEVYRLGFLALRATLRVVCAKGKVIVCVLQSFSY